MLKMYIYYSPPEEVDTAFYCEKKFKSRNTATNGKNLIPSF